MNESELNKLCDSKLSAGAVVCALMHRSYYNAARSHGGEGEEFGACMRRTSRLLQAIVDSHDKAWSAEVTLAVIGDAFTLHELDQDELTTGFYRPPAIDVPETLPDTLSRRFWNPDSEYSDSCYYAYSAGIAEFLRELSRADGLVAPKTSRNLISAAGRSYFVENVLPKLQDEPHASVEQFLSTLAQCREFLGHHAEQYARLFEVHVTQLPETARAVIEKGLEVLSTLIENNQKSLDEKRLPCAHLYPHLVIRELTEPH